MVVWTKKTTKYQAVQCEMGQVSDEKPKAIIVDKIGKFKK